MEIKYEVLQSWKRRAKDACNRIEELKADLAYQAYELEIAQRVLGRAQDDASRETWQMQVDVLMMFVGDVEHDIEEQQEDLVLSEAMIAEIEADLAGT